MRLLISVLFLLFTAGAVLADPILLPSEGEQPVSQGVFYVADSSGLIPWEQLRSGGLNEAFKAVSPEAWNPAIKVYWLRFSVKNPQNIDREWIFDFENWSKVHFYTQDSISAHMQKTGHLVPYRQRDYPVANKNYIHLLVPAGQEIACWVRLESRFNNEKIPQNLEFRVAPRTMIDERDAFVGRIIFAFLGIFTVMFLYNSFVYLSTRLRSYAYYLLVLFFAFYHTAYNSGYIISLFGWAAGFPVGLTWFETISSNLFGISVILFVQDFLKIKARYPVWNKILNAYQVMYVVFALVQILIHYEIGAGLAGITALLTIFTIIILGIKSIKDRYPSAIYFTLGYSAFLLSILVIIYLTMTNSVAQHINLIYFSLPAGTTIEVILFSFALAHMIRVLRRENDENQKRIIAQLQENQELQTKVTRELEQKVQERTAEINAQKEQISRQKEAIEIEKEKADHLLLNILPESTANELKEKGFATPKQYDNVTVLFTDFVAFTQISETLGPDQLVAELDYCFQAFDDIIEKHGLEKIKTIGDAYMAAAGVPETLENGALRAVNAALDIEQFMKRWQAEKKAKGDTPWQLRMGLHTGPVTAGVVGKKKFAFDIWGDTVNMAAVMESRGLPGKVNISETTFELVKGDFQCTHRGKIEGKHQKELDMYLVEALRS